MSNKRRSREEAALVAGGRGGDLPSNWLMNQEESAAACEEWEFPAATDVSIYNESEVPESSITQGSRRRRSAPARLGYENMVGGSCTEPCEKGRHGDENMVNDSCTATCEGETGAASAEIVHEDGFEVSVTMMKVPISKTYRWVRDVGLLM